MVELYYIGRLVEEDIFRLMTNLEKSCKFYIEFQDDRIPVFVNIGNLTYEDNSNRAKIYEPEESRVWYVNPFDKILAQHGVDSYTSVLYRDADKISERFDLKGNPSELKKLLINRGYKEVSYDEFIEQDNLFEFNSIAKESVEKGLGGLFI
ncbi:MAG: hypothetical protein KAT28_04720 [Candidatus Aenigmarchaeota archaeon]|nr:hypothetical protein [Candidatus Aenigmarchaeota archaeon]